MKPIDHTGLVLLTNNHDGNTWNIAHYDTNMAVTINEKINFGQPLTYSTAYVHNNIYCAALQADNNTKNDKYNCFLLWYDIADKKINVYALSINEKENIYYLCHMDHSIVFSTVNNKNEENVYLFNCNNSTCNKLNVCENDFSVECIQADTFRHRIVIGMIGYKAKFNTYIKLVEIHPTEQTIENEYVINLNDKYYLSSLHMNILNGHRFMLSGDYHMSNNMSAMEMNKISNGIYSLLFSPHSNVQASYFDFADINNLSSYQRKTLFANTAHNYTRLLCANDSTMVLVTEFYSINYENDPGTGHTFYNGYNYYNSPTVTRISGYKYLSAIITAIGRNGNIKKCDLFNFNGLILPTVSQILTGYLDSNDHMLVYFTHDGNIYSIIYGKNNIIQPIQSEYILPLSHADIVNKNYNITCQHWYNRYFICHGFQKIIHRNGKKNNSKTVFFATKMLYD